ncbi:MAG: TlpA disulfide reductase family protein [Bacteroidota bacterium]
MNFEVDNSEGLKFYLLNAEERIVLDEGSIEGDSLYLPMHIFDADIKAKITETSISGKWTKNYEDDYSLSFEAVYGDGDRFRNTTASNIFNHTWRVTFVHQNEGDTTEAVGVFKRENDKMTGTFLTPTGDYRYLEGTATDQKMKLSTFDGGHAFLFTASAISEDSLSGHFWSGAYWHETWYAVKDPQAQLPNPDSLTYIRSGYDGLNFSFPGLQGDTISFDDYRGQPLIIDIFGTWCPNCMDQTKFLKSWYDKNKKRGVKILGLAYEAKSDFEYARSRVLKMKNKWNLDYDFAIAGTKDKEEAAKTLPMLNHILAFPTTLFVDAQGKVRRIHTGFTGPGTGLYYDLYVKEFNETVDNILNVNE